MIYLLYTQNYHFGFLKKHELFPSVDVCQWGAELLPLASFYFQFIWDLLIVILSASVAPPPPKRFWSALIRTAGSIDLGLTFATNQFCLILFVESQIQSPLLLDAVNGRRVKSIFAPRFAIVHKIEIVARCFEHILIRDFQPIYIAPISAH